MATLAASFFQIVFILAGNEENYKVSNESEMRPDPTSDYGVSCHWASGKILIGL